TCAIDGAHVVDKLMAVDLVACAAVAIEGLPPPSETRHWEKPRHQVFINSEQHNPNLSTVVRGLMWEMEIQLASEPPHEVIFLDGSITNPILNLNAALSALEKIEDKDSLLVKAIEDRFLAFMEAYETVIENKRTDKLWVGIPKYTSKKEIGALLAWENNYDDRAILTSTLQAGEYTIPIAYEQPVQEWHIGFESLSYFTRHQDRIEALWKNIKNAIHRLHVIYYKPYAYTPALRIEVPQSLKNNPYQLAKLLTAIKFQFGTAGIMEPYPLYMADRMVKSLSSAVPALRQIATRKMAESFESDLSEVYFSMHSYRTES
ncbi:MAG: DNA double-strand break repair nuclease NurA, partial [Pseudomonadota bacterium]|nr:DNA double-strand break repair nuclease NurA [Pseudomonadota bacterium]